MEFTIEEIDLVLEALKALKSKDKNSKFSSALLGMMLSKSKEQAESALDEIMATSEEEKMKEAVMEEQVAIITAKLYSMKRALMVKEMSNSIASGSI